MNRAELLEKLRELKPWLAEQGVGNVRLFGSFARDEAGPDSDVDLVVDLLKPMGLEFFGLANDLEDRLGRRVDLCTEKGMNPRVFQHVSRDIVAL